MAHFSFSRTNASIAALILATAVSIIGCKGGETANAANNQAQNKKAAATATATPTDNDKSDTNVVAAVQKNIDASGIPTKVTAAYPTAMPDIYWITMEGAPALFADKTGKYLIQGQIIEIGQGKPVDISATLIAKNAKETLAHIDKKDMIIFPAKGETKAVIYAFTDPTCGYCRKLHSEIAQTNAAGIEVRYLAWPRAEQIIPLAESIWCSKDRQSALTAAKNDQPVNAPSCKSPVLEQMQIGHNLGVSGTPAIFAENGTQLGGYLPSKELAAEAIANRN